MDGQKTNKVEYVEVESGRAGQRLDNFLACYLHKVPKSHIYRILRTGQVRVNKGRVKPNYKIQAGDSIRIPPMFMAERTTPPLEQLNAQAQKLRESILFENDDFMILNKPSGLAVHGGSGLKFGLIEAVKAGLAKGDGIELVHRLDKSTSGCLMLAKDRETLRQLHMQLRNNEIKKHYLALLVGQLPQHSLTVDSHLKKARLLGGEHMVEISEHGKVAETHIQTVQQFKDFTLVQIQISTGRTHQIRVHCNSIGHPVAGDEKYGDQMINKSLRHLGLKRLFLHAKRLSFTLDKAYVVDAPVPEELANILEQLNDG